MGKRGKRDDLPSITVDELRDVNVSTVVDLARRCQIVQERAERGDRHAIALMRSIGRELVAEVG